jgi:hypothetical protein
LKIGAALCVFLFPFDAALPQQDINSLLDAVVSIKAASNIPNASPHDGTGFVVSATGGDILIVTARHVLFSKDGDPIFDPNGILVTFHADRYNPKPASFLPNGPDNLLFSVLKVTKKDAGNLPPFRAFQLRPQPIGIEDVRVLTGEWKFPKVSVSSTVLNNRLDQFSYNGGGITGGDSGSPVVDLNGLLVGMHQGDVSGSKDGWAQSMREVIATLTGPTMELKIDIGVTTDTKPKDFALDLTYLTGLVSAHRLKELQAEAITSSGRRRWKSTFVITGARSCSIYAPMDLGSLLTFSCIFPAGSFDVKGLRSAATSALPKIEWRNSETKNSEVAEGYNSLPKPLVRIASDEAAGIVSLYLFEQ